MSNESAVKSVTDRLDKLVVEVKNYQRSQLRAAAEQAKRALQTAPGAPRGRMRGVGVRGAAVGVRYKYLGKDKVVVRWYGPAHLVDRPTEAHWIVAARLGERSSRASRQSAASAAGSLRAFGGTGRGRFGGLAALSRTTRSGRTVTARGKQALTIRGDLRAYAAHPGTKGKGFFRRGKQRAEQEIPIAARREFQKSVGRVYRGVR